VNSSNRDPAGRLTRFVTKQGKGVLITRLWKTNSDGERVFASAWTRRIVRNGRQFYFTLPAEREKAEEVANEIDAFLQVRSNTIEDAIARFSPEKRIVVEGRPVATLRSVINLFRLKRDVLDVKKSSARVYVGSIIRMIAVAQARRARRGMKRGKMDAASKDRVLDSAVSCLADSHLVSDFKEAMLASAGADEALRKQRKRTVNSYLRNAASLFTDAAMRQYAAAGLNVPKPKCFDIELPFRKVDKKYRLPEPAVVSAVFDLAPALKAMDRNAYLAYLLALHAGLRKEEIAHCRRGWFSTTAPWRIRIQAEGSFNPKGTEGETEMEEWAYREVMELAGEDTILTGTITDRKDGAFRVLNSRLKSAGLRRFKPAHELRKLFGSYIASTRGIFVAQKFLRHQSAQLTSDDYADNILDETVRARWRAA
jgi:integrase